MQSSRECVRRAIEMEGPDRLPVCLAFDSDKLNLAITKNILAEMETDIMIIGCNDPEFEKQSGGYNQWGYKMENFGETMGEVINPPLESWEVYEEWKATLPDFTTERRYVAAKEARVEYPDKFLLGGLGMMMEEMINLRGYENCMVDYYEEEDHLNQLIDLLYEKGRQMVDGYAEAGMDGVIVWEDWGLQHSPMMSRDLWMDFFYERMKDFVAYIHEKGMKYILHSCGHITYLMDTFIEIGIDVIQMDQQKNMGLELLNNWKHKICFFCPVDIQHSVNMPEDEMREYVQQMFMMLGDVKGGFMYKAYAQPAAIHMTERQLRKEITLIKEVY